MWQLSSASGVTLARTFALWEYLWLSRAEVSQALLRPHTQQPSLGAPPVALGCLAAVSSVTKAALAALAALAAFQTASASSTALGWRVTGSAGLLAAATGAGRIVGAATGGHTSGL
jgi:hypothetical protein